MVDIILIIIALVVALIGAKKGFISVIMKLVGLVLAIILASSFYKGLAFYMYENFDFGKNIENTIVNTVKTKVIENVMGATESDENTDINVEGLFNNDEVQDEEAKEETKISMDFSQVIETVKNWGLYDKVEISENVVVENEQESKNLIEKIAYNITICIMRAIAFISIFLCVIIITAILSLVLSLLFMLPGLKTINKTGGFIAELVLFMIKVLIVLAIISFLQPIGVIDSVIQYINTKTILVRLLYNNNLIFVILNKYL